MAFTEVTPAERVVELRVKGDTFADIAAATGLTASRCAEIFHDYLHESYSHVSELELRWTQLKRLESMLSYLWEIVRSGDALTEGRQSGNALKIIEEINKLMGLYRDPLRDAQVELAKAQADVVYEILAHLRTSLLERLVEGIRSQMEDMPEHIADQLKEYIEASWPSWYVTAARHARGQVAEVTADAAAVAATQPSPYFPQQQSLGPSRPPENPDD